MIKITHLPDIMIHVTMKANSALGYTIHNRELTENYNHLFAHLGHKPLVKWAMKMIMIARETPSHRL